MIKSIKNLILKMRFNRMNKLISKTVADEIVKKSDSVDTLLTLVITTVVSGLVANLLFSDDKKENEENVTSF
jgi:hypothetical protein